MNNICAMKKIFNFVGACVWRVVLFYFRYNEENQ